MALPWHPAYDPETGLPWPDTPEEERQELYAELLADGLSDAEARGTVWPVEQAR